MASCTERSCHDAVDGEERREEEDQERQRGAGAEEGSLAHRLYRDATDVTVSLLSPDSPSTLQGLDSKC